ncbi:MAG TPA: ribonuclease HII [Granulicella sp.]|jgi:ribonuclease HII|nr:ribonuclease HII [Granulicella sp.]
MPRLASNPDSTKPSAKAKTKTPSKITPKAPTPKTVTAATAKQRMLRLLVCSDAPEQALRYRGFQTIAGVDEVGRGALFGPVVAAAVILPEEIGHLGRAGLKDSKQMLREDREAMDREIRRIALAFSIAEIDAGTIDRINIYQATRAAMLAAVEGLSIAPDHLLIDAMRIDHPCAQTKLIYGDSLSLSIAAASVLAKVHRDALLHDLDALHPQYGLAAHKGYATPAHRRALLEHGPCPLHRRSFAPVTASAETQPLLFDEPELDILELGNLAEADQRNESKENVDWV